ncbi:ankyrin repeat domain-containing protein 26-like isoform X3 [Grus americana]|uniref:ankyrin repeat domain-containing protein 26-like isoform X3 n=1 Tax=Grus americana TaxID=9117 RepID=UPI0024087317|nr:ankyrin repeat domain-containing protein 26-like isoform X3 [Grus americana]
MKRFFGFGFGFGFGRKRKGQPPSGSASVPCPAGAYELRQKDLGKLHRAAASGDLARVRQGLKKHGIDGRDKAERTPLHLACASGHVDVVTYLVENKCKLNLLDNDNRSPLMKAVQCQQEECVAILLEHGADPNLADADGNTALHLAVISPNTSVAGLLLEHNANIDAHNKEGYTPLFLAVSEHHEEIVELLLKKGADVHARDQCERTPLMTAASGGELNLIKVLLRYGADVSHKDSQGWTAEDYAVIHGYSSLSEQLAEYTDGENTGEASAGGAQGITVLSTPHRTGAAGFTLGAPAMDRGGMQQSPNQTSRTGKSRKAIDDFSQGDSIRSSEKEGSDDSWHTSEEEELDFTPKKLQKPNLTLLMKASQLFRKNNDGDGSKIESPKTPKSRLKQRTPSHANLNKGVRGELLNQDVSDGSNFEEEELEEKDDDENENGDDDDEDSEEEEEDEEDEDLEDEETRSNDILEEEQGEKSEPKRKINQKLEYFSNAKFEGQAQCGTGDVYDDKISKELDEEVEESVDTPVSFIAGCFERLQENVTAMSPKRMNNEVSCKSVPKQPVFQNVNNLQNTQESWGRKSMIQKFHKNADSFLADSEMTGCKKELLQPLSHSCGLKEKKSNFGDDFESGNNSSSAAKNLRLQSQRQNSVVLEHMDDEDTEEEQYEQVDDKVCEALKQSESLHSNRCEENLRAAFHSSTKEESPQREEEGKEDTGEELRTTVVESVKNSICNDSHQVHNASKGNAGALPPVGAEEDEDDESPWDSESIETDSENMRKGSSGVLLSAADRRGASSQVASGEHNNGLPEKPSNSQLKAPESVLEMSETSPKKRQQKSGALPPVGAEEDEDDESPWDSESIETDSENMRKGSSGVLLSAADRRGASSQVASGEHNNGLPEKPSNSQLKAPESVLEMSETSPKKRQQKSGALPPVGAEEDEDDESPWDSESIETDSENMRKGSSGVLLSAADRRGASSQVASGEHNNGLPEKPSNSQLKAPESVLEMSETSPKKRQQKSGALPPVGAEEDEDDESPWDSESIETDSENMRKGSSGVLLSAADRRGASSQVASGEHNNGLPEKPSNSQLKAPESVLEMSETSPEKRQQKSGEYSGSTSHVSSSAAKQDIKDAIENYGVQVELEKSKERCFKTEEVAKQEDLDKFNTPPGNVTNQQMKQKLTLRKNDCLKMENENTIEEKDKKNLEEKDKKNCSPEERSKLIKMPMKGKFALNAKVARKNKRQTSKQKANQQMSSSSGNHFQVLDDSTFSETSQDDGRLAAKTGTEKNKVSIQMDVTDDLDLTHSSDTTSEDVELPTSIYREAMLLLEQLSVDPRGSAVLLKIQNILLEYEQIIEREKNRYTAVWRALRKLESEKEESQLMAEETKDWKSILAHQEVEWKSDIQTLKFTLKQEEEKRLRVETLNEKTREKLRREDQCCKEMEEKQQLELHSRNLEMELLTLRKVLKQVEEERDETQRQLSQEKSARALQEGILNNHLWRQKELEGEARTIGKNVEESETKREKDLLYKNQLLQDEIAMLRLELDQVRLRHQEEKGKYLEENETLKEKNEDLKKELKLNEEALTQTVFQYNGQLNLLKTESAVLTSKLEQTKESKDRLETEIESFRSRLTTAVQELEHHQSTKSDVERTFQRERDEWLRLQDELHHDLSDVRETNKSLSQQLSKAESKANSLENELHQLKQMLREKTLLLEMTQKELSQAQCQAKECDRARQLEKDQVSKFIIKQESMQERLSQLQSENLLLRQQLEDMQNKGIIKEKVVNAVQDRFNDIFNKLRADTEKQVYLVEERNKELNVKCTDLRDQVFKYETDKVEREMQKQNVLAWTSKDAHSMWEEQLKSRYHLEERVAQLDREKAELLEQCESERKQAKKLAELKRPVELHLDQEMKRNIELQKDCKRLKRLLNRAMNKLRMYKERESQLHFQGEMKNRYSEMVNEVGRLRAKVGEHSQQLEIESKKCMQLEAQNQDLRELSTMHGNHEELEKSKCQLKEEVANLKHHLETNMVDHSQIEQYKREMEERTRQEIRQRLQEVNLFLQTQAASQDRLEQIRANHHASLRNQLKHRIRDLECELDRIKSTQKDSIFQKESTQAEVERYKGLYLEEVKIRRCLANKLQRANERLAEANAKLLQERHRSKSLIASSIVSGGLAASPVLYSAELGHLGNNLALNRSVSLGGSFLSPTGNALASRNRVEAYVAKVRQELDEKITKELEQATAELEAGSAGASPMSFNRWMLLSCSMGFLCSSRCS